MTEKLKTLLHEQASVPDFPPLDLTAITAVGDRRVRRRRGAGLVAGVAVLAVVGGVAAVSLGGDDGTQAVDRPPVLVPEVTWGTGTTLHTPDGETDLGVPIAAYVRTTVGYVLTDGVGSVFSYVDGATTKVGAIADRLPRITADTDGTLVGWVDPTGDPTYVVLDLASGDVRRFDGHAPVDFEGTVGLDALDDRTAYWQDERGSVAVDVDTGAVRLLDEDWSGLGTVFAAEDGTVARNPSLDPNDMSGGPVLQSEQGEIVLEGSYGDSAVFSPDGRYISLEADTPEVYDAHTGDPVRIDVADRWFATGAEWLDDDTLVAVSAQGRKAQFELSTCSIPAGSCTTVAEIGTERDLEEQGLTLADGQSGE